MNSFFQQKNQLLLFLSLFIWLAAAAPAAALTTALFNEGIYIIPHPQEVSLGGVNFALGNELSIVLDRNASDKDRFTATELAVQLKQEWGVNAVIDGSASGKTIILTHKGISKDIAGLPKKKAQQGYQLTSTADQLVIRAKGEAGLFYGTQTLLQIIKKGTGGAYGDHRLAGYSRTGLSL